MANLQLEPCARPVARWHTYSDLLKIPKIGRILLQCEAERVLDAMMVILLKVLHVSGDLRYS